MATPEIVSEPDRIVLDHGTGAKLSQELIARMIGALGDVYLGEMEDSAQLTLAGNRIAVTTDSFVLSPPFLLNTDIGRVAVCGTVNDIAVSGARPLYLTLAFVIEEGFPVTSLLRVLGSIRAAAREAGVKIVAGDTKVVNRGAADQIFVNTTGIGVFERPPLSMKAVAPGDKILVSSWLGNHSVHVLSIREGLGFETRVQSDCAPLNGLVDRLLEAVPPRAVRSIRDVTRGGLSAVLHEYAQARSCTVRFDFRELPIQAETAMAADMLGVNPLHLANEGCLCLFVDPRHAEQALAVLRADARGRAAAIVGEVGAATGPKVLMRRSDGTESVLEELWGAELPRLC